MNEHLSSDERPSFSGADELKVMGEQSPEPVVPEHIYERLVSHGAESSEELRARYFRYTEKMVAHVLELGQDTTTMDENGLKETGVTMVFLDKSARPTYWLMDEFWKDLAPGYKRPDIKFANIDREQWQNVTGRIDPDDGGHDVDVNRLSQQVFDDLSNTYRDPSDGTKSVFAGKHIMVVDETRTSGTTLEIAEQMFKKSFPDAVDVSGHHWMVRPSGRQRTAEVAVWYDENTPYGRGVGNRNADKSLASASSRQQDGQMFLSVAPDKYDSGAHELREDIKALHQDILAGKQRFSIAELDDSTISPAMLARAEGWRKLQRQQNGN